MSLFQRKCETIMVKNLLVRKRHWLLTLFEILCPLALFALLTYVRNSSSITGKGEEHPMTFNKYMTESYIIEALAFMDHDHVNLAYAPKTPFTTEVMRQFNSTPLGIYLKNRTILASFDSLETEAELEQLFRTLFQNKSAGSNYIGYGIVFENVDKNSSDIPKNFKYKIRSTSLGWNTNKFFPDILVSGPMNGGDNYIYNGFLSIQMAIDKVYLKMANPSKKSNYEVVLQKFPYPSYVQDDIFKTVFQVVMPICTMLSFVLICPSILKRLVEEKSSGVKELMKMMGLDTWMVWTGWLINAMMVYTISVIMITVALCASFDEEKGPVISYVHWSVLFMFFFLFCIASVCFIFSISAPFSKPTIAMCVGILVWVLLFSVLQSLDRTSLPFPIKILLGMFIPLMTVFYGFDVTAVYESRQDVLSWSNLFSDGIGGHGMSMGVVMLLLISSSIINYVLALYIDAVFPGPYGIARPWYFIFESFVRKHDSKEHNLMSKDFDDDSANYESPPSGLKVGLRIRNLRKVFGSTMFKSGVVAVEKVSLDVYQGEITALLGHNGAGKTTTMSMITGMFSPSSGSVYFKGYNIFDNIQQFRSSLGLCPQVNLLFSYLNVIEHLIFFGMLKGLSYSESKKEGLNLLNMLHIRDKKNNLVCHLSGGMKRKLSLAIALIGKPEVLMLDEPTSGMDPESRREMWDLLLSLRGERTIMITTHFMEEADVLGDRIAIMDHGHVSCYGTTLFLKKLYGTGYSLTVMKDMNADAQNITSFIREHIPNVEVKNLLPGQVTYNLPQEMTSNFASLFAVLETKKSNLGIKGFGIACTSMEEVFLKVGGLSMAERYEVDNKSTNAQIMDNILHKDISTEELTYKKLVGLPLVLHQFSSLLKKKRIYCLRKWLSSLAFVLMPLFTMFSGVKVDMDEVLSSVASPPLEMSLAAYGQTSVYITADPSAKNVTDAYNRLIQKEGSEPFQNNSYIINKLLAESEENIARFRTKMVVAAEFNRTTANGLFSSIALHAAPISLNMISNALLQSDSTTSSNKITTVNHPIDLNGLIKIACTDTSIFTMLIFGFLWVSCVPVGLLFLLSDFIAFPNTERVTNAKQLQLMAGVSPLLYWLATFIWDYLIWMVITIAMVVIILLFDKNDIFSHQKEISIFMMIVLLFGVSGIIYTYFFSYLTKTSAGATSLFLLLNLVFGLISTVVMYFVDNIQRQLPEKSLIYMGVNTLLLLNPYYAVSSALMRFAIIAAGNRDCVRCGQKAPPDCVKAYLVSEDNNNIHGILDYTLFLAFDWVLYLMIILLVDYGLIPNITTNIIDFIVGICGGEINLDFQVDMDVRDERDRVDAARNNKDHTVTDRSSVILTVDRLTKKFGRHFVAVRDINFQVSAGECFGLLGVNGAGKTTTFRMLTGAEQPTAGDANIFNYNLTKNRAQYLKQIGYCPQFDGINEVLTGDEMLEHFAVIRGIPYKHVKGQVDEWISLLGLEEYRQRRSGTYSGGNKRKLSTAMALIGDPPIVFLDEPTSGVDPVARRNLWNVLIRCQKSGQAIVLTSHSMEECEALCTRLTILVRGRMMCIGSTQHLKTRYGQGYTIMIKLRSHPEMHTLLSHLKQDIETTFTSNCVLKDEHQGFLHYHLPDNSIPLSRIFSSIHRLKQLHTIIEDYTVADTTLEQVFLAFAKNSEALQC